MVRPSTSPVETRYDLTDASRRNSNVSHIAAGYQYSSPSQKKVRVDLAYDSVLGSSLFDYSNVTNEGVSNVLWTLTPAVASAPAFFVGFTEPAFPLIPRDLLVAGNAVFAGHIQDDYVGAVTSVSRAFPFSRSRVLLLTSDMIFSGISCMVLAYQRQYLSTTTEWSVATPIGTQISAPTQLHGCST